MKKPRLTKQDLYKKTEVDYFLKSTSREPQFIGNKKAYLEYLTDPTQPLLLTDNKELIIRRLKEDFPQTTTNDSMTVDYLKDLLDSKIDERKNKIIGKEKVDIKEGREYENIKEVFKKIKSKDIYDPSLMLEWNVWRAMTMIDGGDIHANLKFDDYGKPLSTALGNMADIVCNYGDFDLTVEVTTQTGQRQYEMEGEPVMRHLGKQKAFITLISKISPNCFRNFAFLGSKLFFSSL